MNIDERLSKLEKIQRMCPGAFVLTVKEDGTAVYVTKNGEKREFRTEEDALAEIKGRYEDPCIVVIDV